MESAPLVWGCDGCGCSGYGGQSSMLHNCCSARPQHALLPAVCSTGPATVAPRIPSSDQPPLSAHALLNAPFLDGAFHEG